nr:SidA/IucD/PvdA family monooxygenase [Salinispora oceanensis]
MSAPSTCCVSPAALRCQYAIASTALPSWWWSATRRSNARFDQVSRAEFRGYLEWVAQSHDNIAFGEKVLAVDFHTDRFTIETSSRRSE